MKVSVVLLSLVLTALAEELTPYAPSGWKPDGPAFDLPSFGTTEQRSPTNGRYSPTQNVQTNFGNFQPQRQLTYKEYIEQQNRNTGGFQQQLPNQYITQTFQPTERNKYDQLAYHEKIGNLNNYQQLPGISKQQEFRSEKQIINDYLPAFDPQIDVRAGNQNNRARMANLQANQYQTIQNPMYITTNQHSDFMPNLHHNRLRQNGRSQQMSSSVGTDMKFADNSPVLNKQQSNFGANVHLEESRARKQIPDQYLPSYDPKVTHIEEKGNSKSRSQTQIHRSPSFRSQNNGKQLKFEETTDKSTQSAYNYDGIYRTIIDDEILNDDSFGIRISTSTRRPKTPQRSKPINQSDPNQAKFVPDQPNVAISTAVANGRYFRRQNNAVTQSIV